MTPYELEQKETSTFPTSTNDAWLERLVPRLSALANLSSTWQDVDLALQMGPHFRSAINTRFGFRIGQRMDHRCRSQMEYLVK